MKKIVMIMTFSIFIVFLNGFNFVEFVKNPDLEVAKKEISSFKPISQEEQFKKKIVLFYCNFGDFEKSLPLLDESIEIANSITDSLSLKKCGDFFYDSFEIQKEIFSSNDFSYEDIKDMKEPIISMLKKRIDVCVSLKSITILENEKIYLSRLNNIVFKFKNGSDFSVMFQKIDDNLKKLRKVDYRNIKRH